MPKVNDHNLARPRMPVRSDGLGAGGVIPASSHVNTTLTAATVTTLNPPGDTIALYITSSANVWLTLDGSTSPNSTTGVGFQIVGGVQPIFLHHRPGAAIRLISDVAAVVNIQWLTGV